MIPHRQIPPLKIYKCQIWIIIHWYITFLWDFSTSTAVIRCQWVCRNATFTREWMRKIKKRFECICIKLARCAKNERLFVQLDGLNIRLIDCTFGPCFHNSVAQANCKYLPLNGTFYLTRLNALNFHLFSHQRQKLSPKGANALAVSKCKRLQFVHVAWNNKLNEKKKWSSACARVLKQAMR